MSHEEASGSDSSTGDTQTSKAVLRREESAFDLGAPESRAADPRGYQTLINEALKQAIERESLEDTLRRVLREEGATYKVSKRK